MNISEFEYNYTCYNLQVPGFCQFPEILNFRKTYNPNPGAPVVQPRIHAHGLFTMLDEYDVDVNECSG